MVWVCTNWHVDWTAIAAVTALAISLWGLLSAWLQRKRYARLAAVHLHSLLFESAASLNLLLSQFAQLSQAGHLGSVPQMRLIAQKVASLPTLGTDALELAKMLGPVSGKLLLQWASNDAQLRRLAAKLPSSQSHPVRQREECMHSLRVFGEQTFLTAEAGFFWAWNLSGFGGEAPNIPNRVMGSRRNMRMARALWNRFREFLG